MRPSEPFVTGGNMGTKGADRKGRSKAQEELAARIGEWMPFARIRQEVYVGELIEAHGYSADEIARELGNRLHRLFCDIYVSDSDGDFVVEYHGEQHYHVVEGMTSTERALALNQHLDREKSWILERIGVPLVAVPYDSYVDEEVLMRLLDDATHATQAAQSELYLCDDCGRRFPSRLLSGGLCQRCRKAEAERVEREFRKAQEHQMAIAEEDLPADDDDEGRYESQDDIPYDADDDWEARRKEEQKAEAKARRKAAYQQWKESPEYQRRKEEQKAARRKAYQERKAWLKEQRRQQRDED